MNPIEIEKDVMDLELMIGSGNCKADSVQVIPTLREMSKSESIGYCLGLLTQEFASLNSQIKSLTAERDLLKSKLEKSEAGRVEAEKEVIRRREVAMRVVSSLKGAHTELAIAIDGLKSIRDHSGCIRDQGSLGRIARSRGMEAYARTDVYRMLSDIARDTIIKKEEERIRNRTQKQIAQDCIALASATIAKVEGI